MTQHREPAQYMKAIWAAFACGMSSSLSSLLTAWQGKDPGWDTITPSQWVTALLAFFIGALGAGGVTFRVENRP